LPLFGRRDVFSSFDEETIKQLPRVSLTGGFYGANDDVVIKTITSNTLPVAGPSKALESLGPLQMELPPCNLNVVGGYRFVDVLMIDYRDHFGVLRTMRLTTVGDFEKSEKAFDELSRAKPESKMVRLSSLPFDEAIVWGTPAEEMELEWKSLVG